MDFKQLQIENQQLSERCEEKNHELLRLKVRAAKALQILNTYKVSIVAVVSIPAIYIPMMLIGLVSFREAFWACPPATRVSDILQILQPLYDSHSKIKF